MKTRIYFVIFITLFGVFVAQNVSADVDVSGFIFSDTTWSSGEVYVVWGDVSISSGVTLTIEPGAVIKFNSGAYLAIHGTLNAIGTENSQIYFTSIKDDSVGGDTNEDGSETLPSPYNWSQISIADGANANFDYVDVRYGGYAYPAYSSIVNNGNLSISNSFVGSGSTGIRIFNGSATIENVLIKDNDSVAISVDGGSAVIKNSIIENNDYGIVVCGGFLADISATVERNIIRNNNYGVFTCGNYISLSQNSISGNNLYGLYNSSFAEVNAENNWWGDASGPYNLFNNINGSGNKVSNFIDFEPWLTSEPDFGNETSKEPVLIIPGILGSRLNRASDGEEIWPKINLMAVPGPDNYLNELKLDESSGEIIDVDSSEIIESVLTTNQYGNLIQKFKDSGYELEKDLFVVPYDWRLDVGVSSNELDLAISEALDKSLTGKVNIVAHSMGGLLAKDYLIRNGEDKINKVIFAGTPHLGAPKAFNLLNWGDDFDLKFLGLGLNKNKAKEIGQNMPAVYQLLPSREYLNKIGSYLNTTDDLDYDQTEEFMISSLLLSDHRNSNLLDRGDQFHQSRDGWIPQSANIFNLLGCREYDTIGSFTFDEDGSVDINSITGDGTVPLGSANHIPGEKYYVSYPQTKINHMGLVSDERTIGLIYNIISDLVPVLPQGISQEKGDCDAILNSIKRLRFSTHSPVNLHIYDSLGNHTGLKPDGNIEISIPDSNFIQAGESSFVFVPGGAHYTIHIDAYDVGKFDFKVKELVNGEEQNSIIYNDVPINSPNLDADFEFIGIDNVGILKVDRDGDGLSDAGYLANGTWISYNATIQSTLADLERVYSLGWTIGEVKNSLSALLMASLPKAETIQSKGKKADGVLGTAFLKQLETEYNKGSINVRGYNIIKADILLLLDNE
jgi:pimeloyl-ACP methyl ester carboxylesterase